MVRDVLWNLLGESLPVVAAIVAIPVLVHGLGVGRFGVLTLAWLAAGYFATFDMGIGRAVTKLMAEKLALGDHDRVSSLFWTSMILTFVFGIAGAVIVALLSRSLVYGVLKVPSSLRTETLGGFYVIAGALPLIVSTSALRGILAALRRFDMINLVRTPTGMLSTLAPVFVLPFSHSLVWLITAMVANRALGWIAYLVLSLRAIPPGALRLRVSGVDVAALLGFGGWVTVSNIVYPAMTFVDRMMIGSIVSMAAVAYYATPAEIIVKMTVLPGAITSVLFPALSGSLADGSGRAPMLFNRATRWLLLLLFPAVLFAAAFAHQLLAMWVGANFADHSAVAFRWMVVGLMVFGFATPMVSMVQALHRPDITAKMNLVELPLYVPFLWWMIETHGVAGAACAVAIRLTVEAVVLAICTARLVPGLRAAIGASAAMLAGLLAVVAIAATMDVGIVARSLFVAVAMPGTLLAGLLVFFPPHERAELRGYLAVFRFAGQQ